MNYTFVFTNQELGIIFGALQEKPYKEVAPVIESIRMQIAAAEAELSKEKEEEKEKENGDNE